MDIQNLIERIEENDCYDERLDKDVQIGILLLLDEIRNLLKGKSSKVYKKPTGRKSDTIIG